ncbi:ADP-dependent (S)-NAD(P)H-hydrate dehydratase [Flavobacterium noncentrifugens]|uniref:ADP-dependent (S)-NAD(P)H-hydrate dehydratase n=1 Tax=Flavobacterium noncentrifugens TaxID=1128970 RepID=A0A1G8ZZK2_9FLAO|nr:NAD(P)H-hydrate dehydratase [Flavobacterium noncentrifugens]GEP51770.1 ADP-dependent (S)-NAD(P)H-hydrate dehydratase [Flavobacterium noncentrifugens]SDK20538.1 yjeF C-terminal region, hydroxyethylthiazole kinase-related [Flavobacterium noncentrifugens]
MQKITKLSIQKILKKTDPQTHKGKQGHALLIGGSYGKIGSITLSSKAALHTGCGLVTAFIPECGYEIVQTAIPEVMVLTDKEKKNLSDIAFEIIPQAIGIGPGIGQEQSVQNALHHFLQTVKTPLVVDADALNILSEHKEWLSLLPKNTILTPHPKELERLIGHFETPEETLQKTIEFSLQHEIIIVMKGAPTKIIDGENGYQNTTGNAALATAGTGDVLTGIITGLLAQAYDPIQAAILGVYLHGLTADIALPKTGTHAFIASYIIKNLGKAYLSLEK